MLIKYNKPNAHTICSLDGKQVAFLRPGLNEFPEAIWKQHMERKNEDGSPCPPDKFIQAMLDADEMELVQVSGKDGKKKVVYGKDDAPVVLKNLEDKDALSLVKATLNKDLLERWLSEDCSAKVRKALEAQLKPLLPESNTASS